MEQPNEARQLWRDLVNAAYEEGKGEMGWCRIDDCEEPAEYGTPGGPRCCGHKNTDTNPVVREPWECEACGVTETRGLFSALPGADSPRFYDVSGAAVCCFCEDEHSAARCAELIRDRRLGRKTAATPSEPKIPTVYRPPMTRESVIDDLFDAWARDGRNPTHTEVERLVDKVGRAMEGFGLALGRVVEGGWSKADEKRVHTEADRIARAAYQSTYEAERKRLGAPPKGGSRG
jgi:hypothetical protein